MQQGQILLDKHDVEKLKEILESLGSNRRSRNPALGLSFSEDLRPTTQVECRLCGFTFGDKANGLIPVDQHSPICLVPLAAALSKALHLT